METAWTQQQNQIVVERQKTPQDASLIIKSAEGRGCPVHLDRRYFSAVACRASDVSASLRETGCRRRADAVGGLWS